MVTSKVTYISDLRTEMVHQRSGNSVKTDAPVDNHGKGEAFSPTDLMVTSMASCMLTIVGINASENGYSIDGARAEVTKIMSESPRRVGEIIVDFYFPDNNYSEKQKTIIKNVAFACPVSKSLHPDIKQTISFHF